MINDYEATKPIIQDATYQNTESLSNDDVISTLNGLIQTCKDGQDGYQAAAEGIERSDLKSLFYEFAQQRSRFAGELQSLVHSLGGDPESTGSLTGTIHRGWMDLKSTVTGNNEQSILNDCERGEDPAKDAYESALQQGLPENIMETVQEQFTAVRSAHDRIKALRDSAGERSSSARTSN